MYAFGVQRDSVITVKFNEAVDFSSIFDVIFWITPRDNDPLNWGEGDRIILRVDNYHGIGLELRVILL